MEVQYICKLRDCDGEKARDLGTPQNLFENKLSTLDLDIKNERTMNPSKFVEENGDTKPQQPLKADIVPGMECTTKSH